MVTITREGDNFVFEIKGLHKLWAFKSQLTIPAEHNHPTIGGVPRFRTRVTFRTMNPFKHREKGP